MFKSLKIKLIALISFLVVVTAGLISFFVYVNTLDRVQYMLGQRAVSIAKTAAISIDGDEHAAIVANLANAGEMSELSTIREQLRKIKKENHLKTDVYTYINAYWLENQIAFIANSSPEPFAIKGQALEPYMRNALKEGKSGYTNIVETINGAFITGFAPILTSEGDITGVLEVALDTSLEIASAKRELMYNIGLASLAGLSIAILLTFFISHKIVSPIVSLTAIATKMAKGYWSVRSNLISRDEVGVLSNTFNKMVDQIQEMFAEIEESNRKLKEFNEKLEALVAKRTEEVKRILDNVQSGLLLVDGNLKIQKGHSKSCSDLFGQKEIAGKSLTEVIGLNEEISESLKLAIDQVVDDFLPENVTLSQVPSRFEVRDRILKFEGKVIRDKSGAVSYVLFTIFDITQLEKSERENIENRSLINILSNLNPFKEFINDAKERLHTALEAIEQKNEKLLRRELHTIKGNSGFYGMKDLVECIHEIESKVQITHQDIESVQNKIIQFLDAKFSILKMNYDEGIDHSYQVKESELLELTQTLDVANGDRKEAILLSWITEVKKHPISEVLGSIDPYVQQLAVRMNKQVNFQLKGAEVRVERQRFEDLFKNLIHLIRNAIDHGIEDQDERREKPEIASLILEFRELNSSLEITVSDDGRGIDYQAVLRQAVEKGLITDSDISRYNEKDALNLIFSPGFSTANSVSEISGRGVGMEAVKNAVEAAGGTIKIDTKPGEGTTFNIKLPMDAKSLRKIA